MVLGTCTRSAVAFLMLAAVLVITACGGSATPSARLSTARGVSGFTSQEVAARACLDRHAALPVTRAVRPGHTLASLIRQEAGTGAPLTNALRVCGVGSAGGPSLAEVLLAPKRLLDYLDGWIACIAKHGYNLPRPNTSGHGPVFPSGIDRISQYRAAATHCVAIERHELSALRLAARG